MKQALYPKRYLAKPWPMSIPLKWWILSVLSKQSSDMLPLYSFSGISRWHIYWRNTRIRTMLIFNFILCNAIRQESKINFCIKTTFLFKTHGHSTKQNKSRSKIILDIKNLFDSLIINRNIKVTNSKYI